MRPSQIFFVAVGVGVASQVEPVTAVALAVVRRRKQAIDEALDRRRAGIADEIVDLGRRRRQADQVNAQSPNERVLVGFRAKVMHASLSSRARMNASIGLRTHATFLTAGTLRPLDRLERPMVR